MGVTIHVNGTSLSLAHKGCMGITKSTLPDVCKTPSPGGPVPIPYPVIISLSNSLKKGTRTVKVDGRNPAAVKGSEYSRCNGDEPGTAGGVKSSTNMKEATWILYSFDVKLDGKNACRLSDKMMMNHGNTVCMSGTVHRPVLAGQLYKNQTCPDARREQIHRQKDKICSKFPGGSMSPSKVSPKKLAKISCRVIIARIKKQQKCLRVRLKMDKECFAQGPLPGDPDTQKADKVHKQAIADMRSGIKASKDLANTNCRPGAATRDI